MIPVTAQWASALIMLYGGITLGLLYRLLRSFCYGNYSRLRIHIVDALWVICLFICLFFSLLYATGGTIRAYALISFFLGFISAYVAFGPLFTFILKKIHKK